jgi:hypothetical protein
MICGRLAHPCGPDAGQIVSKTDMRWRCEAVPCVIWIHRVQDKEGSSASPISRQKLGRD